MFSGYFSTKELLQREIEKNRNLEKELDGYKTENKELKEIRMEAETRATKYAKSIKEIDGIMFQEGYGSIIDRMDKIKEVLHNLSNQL